MPSERSWVEINLDNFEHNLHELKRFLLPGQEWLQIVKADAYGHGAYEIALIAIQQGAAYLGVANPEEGKMLRIQGIKAPILILSPALPEEIDTILEYKLTPTISDLDFAIALNSRLQSLSPARADGIPSSESDGMPSSEAEGMPSSEAEGMPSSGLARGKPEFATPYHAIQETSLCAVHVKVDTGMHRSGIRLEELAAVWHTLGELQNLRVEGIFSHYAASEVDDSFTQQQSAAFAAILQQLHTSPRYIHLANSSALLRHNTWQTNLVRWGIMSYGIYTDPAQYQELNLKSVMTFKSTLAQIKDIKAGEYIGYNRTWQAERDGRYGIVPVGYADGYDFLLSNLGIAAVNQQICRIVGKVSMDMITVDLSAIPAARAGDLVILLGGGANLLRAEQLTGKYQGSAYELLCQIGRRAKRFYFRDEKLVSSSPLARRDFVSTDYSANKLSQIISSAINQRLQNTELAELVYKEVLRGFFFNKDNDIHYRSDFVHEIELSESEDYPDFYIAHTSLSFRKRLQNNYFIVACANSDEVLKRYFLRKDVEYRWLMDTNISVDTRQFSVTKVAIQDLELSTHPQMQNGCLEISCTHPDLERLVDTDVTFSIETQTLYPKASHQMSIFISELTRGITISFRYPAHWKNVETVTVFSGQNKYPAVTHVDGTKITVSTAADEWIFPNSGIVFAY